jgi:hypothetical protein
VATLGSGGRRRPLGVDDVAASGGGTGGPRECWLVATLGSGGWRRPSGADCAVAPHEASMDGARPEERRPMEAPAVVARAGQRWRRRWVVAAARLWTKCWIDPNGRPTARDLVSGGPPDPAP